MYNIINYVIKYTIALAFLLLPRVSFSILIGNIEKSIKLLSVHINSQYKPSISQISNYLIQENNSKEKKINILNLSNNTITYNMQLENSTTNFRFIIGYFFKRLRFAVEDSYEEFHIKDNDSLKANLSKYSYKMYNEDFQNFTIATDNKLSITSAIVNICYDILINNTTVLPHLCTAVGICSTGFFNDMRFKLLYQRKIGLGYLINSNVMLFFNVYYHKVMRNKLKNLLTQYSVDINAFLDAITVLANTDIGYFGSEVGVRFIFN
ncbi:P44/Msp2 family outer membrane protein [Ehrlichia canis]|uniref:Surface antigen msp4 n=2 Tax=Ehrlichia canis TaxID=944 RepID=A0ACA6AX60_EHRCJ|nr:P44/Msp2 family outer membrane protein [Ehrlichia canis]AAK28685.1 major outer membrane protein P30-15 [Ehrlichia canis]AAZ68931.1 Surface antigen msp4 [Ehrlichia canis str. Jake]AUO55134.1 P44/Msp2 family outer membrane protein [Ehrlichia canis]UKC53430.1 P44/Msp2 family outer membrane protein [Ehrlichia canis]UKC54366.1 P44/Msp2 family outer membrane protein [Ehrlichia canis]